MVLYFGKLQNTPSIRFGKMQNGRVNGVFCLTLY